MVGRLQRESEIVHGEDVFEKFRGLEVADAAGLARGIEFVGQRVGAHVEIVVVVFRFVDAHAPQNDAGAIPIAPDHSTNVVDGDVFPRLIANVLPARESLRAQANLFHRRRPESAAIADSEEVRTMLQCSFVAKNIGVAALRAPWHPPLAHEWERLMTVGRPRSLMTLPLSSKP